MDAIAQYFDHYVISARIKPAFFVVLPLAATVIAWWPDAQQLGGAILTFLVTFGVIGFLSNLISNRGNELQKYLFAKWRGAPTTAMLRFKDSRLDIHTKERYHRRLEIMIPGMSMPSKEREQVSPSDADVCYDSAVNFLREYTRDKSVHSMVYADNVAYGYARNLLAMRPWGIASALAGTVANGVLLSGGSPPVLAAFIEGRVGMQPLLGLGALGVSLTMLCLFAFVVSEDFVKPRAERYAKSLLATCDKLS